MEFVSTALVKSPVKGVPLIDYSPVALASAQAGIDLSYFVLRPAVASLTEYVQGKGGHIAHMAVELRGALLQLIVKNI